MDLTNSHNISLNFNDITLDFYKMCFDLFISNNQEIFLNQLFELLEKYDVSKFIFILNAKRLIHAIRYKYVAVYKICLMTYIKSDLMQKLKSYLEPYNITNEESCLNKTILLGNKFTSEIQYLESFKMLKSEVSKNKNSINITDDNANDNTNDVSDDMIDEIVDDIVDEITDEIVNDTINDIVDDIVDDIKIVSKIDLISAKNNAIYDEIIIRFSLLTEHFGEKMLLQIGIQKITIEEIDKLPIRTLAKYHDTTINKIKKFFNQLSELCIAYLDIETGCSVYYRKFLKNPSKVDTHNYMHNYVIITKITT